MGDIHHFPAARERSVRLLEAVVRDAIVGHPDPQVAVRWLYRARQTIARWPGPPVPSLDSLVIDTGRKLDTEQRVLIIDACSRWIDGYFEEVGDQMMDMHREMLSLQKQLAEFEVAREDTSVRPDQTHVD